MENSSSVQLHQHCFVQITHIIKQKFYHGRKCKEPFLLSVIRVKHSSDEMQNELLNKKIELTNIKKLNIEFQIRTLIKKKMIDK